MARVVSSLFAEVADPGQVRHLGGQLQSPVVKAADVAGTLDQVARVTRAQLSLLLAITLQQPVDHLGSNGNFLALALENPRVLFRSGRSQVDAIAHAPQKGRVRDQIRTQVSGDDEYMAQRHLDLLTRAQREIVNLVLHGGDEIQQLVGRHAFAAEVIDQEDAPVGLEMRRRLVVALARAVWAGTLVGSETVEQIPLVAPGKPRTLSSAEDIRANLGETAAKSGTRLR